MDNKIIECEIDGIQYRFKRASAENQFEALTIVSGLLSRFFQGDDSDEEKALVLALYLPQIGIDNLTKLRKLLLVGLHADGDEAGMSHFRDNMQNLLFLLGHAVVGNLGNFSKLLNRLPKAGKAQEVKSPQ